MTNPASSATTTLAQRIQLLPNNAQKTHFRRACGIARKAWNWGLSEWERQYKAGERPTAFGVKKAFIPHIDTEWPWMRECSSYVYAQAFTDLGRAYSNFFRAVKQSKSQSGVLSVGYPRFKVKGKARDSFYLANTCIKLTKNHVYIQKLGWVRMTDSLALRGKIIGCRISRTADKWFIAIQVEIPEPEPQAYPYQNHVGVDLGSREHVLSDGRTIATAKPYRAQLKRLKRLQRGLRNKQKGSANREKQKRAIAKLHAGVAARRATAQHQLTAALTRDYAEISIQKWDIKGMTKSARGTKEKPGRDIQKQTNFNRAFLDAGWYEIRRQIEYKAARRGAVVHVVPGDVATAQTCSECCALNPHITPEMDVFVCQSCGHEMPRKLNTAINVKRASLGQFYSRGGASPSCRRNPRLLRRGGCQDD